MRIRTAIFGVYVGACAAGFAVLMGFMLAEVRPRYVTAVREHLRDAAHVLAATLHGRAPEEAAAALSSPATFQVRLVGGDGRVLADTHEPGDAAGEDGAAPAQAWEVSVAETVRFADGTAGRIVLSRSFRSVNAVIWNERAKLAGIGLSIAAVMVIAGWWIAARLTHALERLTVHAQAVRDGRASSPPQSRAKEIADLSRAFEEMRDALEGRQHVERYTQALAHEVKAPLAAIRGAAELIDEQMPPEQRRKFLGNIRAESARIQQIVERLLELSSLEARKTLRQTTEVRVDELTAEAVAAVRGAAEAAGVRLEVRAEAGQVRGERLLLREALVNLLQNAIEFSPRGGGVTLAVHVRDGRAEFAVEDEGPGVPEYALPRVFERFYSLPRPDTARKSSGLGLALVREIAHLHGGEAALANRAAGGARASFTVALSPH
ncbi:MAG: ATP-binding protein [Candidatus Didemnitutus sp.]|nr:ATP-binding protein [Candidatus Didemnitutus sp.]